MNLTQKIKRLIAIEKQRYHNKGTVNIIIGFTLFLSLIWVANTISR